MDHHQRPRNHQLKQALVRQGQPHCEHHQSLREAKVTDWANHVRQKSALEWETAKAMD
jgi:hypothetical protein